MGIGCRLPATDTLPLRNCCYSTGTTFWFPRPSAERFMQHLALEICRRKSHVHKMWQCSWTSPLRTCTFFEELRALRAKKRWRWWVRCIPIQCRIDLKLHPLKSQLASLVFAVNRFFFKVHETDEINTVQPANGRVSHAFWLQTQAYWYPL